MIFEKDYIYHIYNQGDNKRKIFFTRDNYLFFLRKINTKGFAQSETFGENTKTFNFSIGLLLRSYTNAINKQENNSGSLFRKETKAECVNCLNGIEPSFITKNGITQINIQHTEKQYPKICFDYIHQNPFKANLVKQSIDWEFSSAIDYANLRIGKLVNKDISKEYGLI